MPKLTVEGCAPVDVPDGKRLVLAMEQDAGVDVLHACGGNARCTACRVEFVSGEPENIAQAEQALLAQRSLTGVRLSCQIVCDRDMTVRAVSKHIGVLEAAGLVTRGRDAQRRPSQIRAEPLAGIDAWLDDYRALWNSRFDRLDARLTRLQTGGDNDA